MTPERDIFAEIKKSRHLPKLPQVMLKLIKACNDEKSNTQDLTDIISTDPGLTSKLLQIIGSPYINLPEDVNTIKGAVVYLGLDTIRNIAISSSAMHFFSLAKNLPEFNISRFWFHSYKCGLLAQRLARECGLPNTEEFFLAGLLHDIGRLILIQACPDEYKSILKSADGEEEILVQEMEKFGADAPRVSAWFFRQWNLNPLISGAVMFINEPADKIKSELVQIKVVYMANILANPSALERIPELASFSELPGDLLEEMTTGVEQEVMEMAANLGLKLDQPQGGEDDTAIAGRVRDYSLFYGTLENLLMAKDLDSIMEIVHNGLKIIFDVGRVFFFFPDHKQTLLSGDSWGRDKLHKIVKSIALPMSNRTSLLVRSVKEKKVQCSFRSENKKVQAISDTQIIRLLEADGFYTVPVFSRERVVCLLVMGVDQTAARQMDKDQGLVEVFSRQVGVCMENILFHREYALDMNEKKMEAYATLTNRVVHEINNPIAIIKNYLETLRLKLPDKHPAQEDLSVVGEEMTRVSTLLEDLSVFARPKIGGFEFLDINRFCSRIFDLLKKSFFMSRQIEATMVADPDLPRVKTDGNALKQVLINLFKNAAEAMETGGKIEVRTKFLADSSKIMIDEKKRVPGEIEIQISDNGPGISPEIKNRLFEPYNSSKTGKKNSGLGLAIVHSIVKELNGRITCESREGKGTRFSIFLPVLSGNDDPGSDQ
ncbi:HDOD domain-containing protein [Desulfospira joergensenii]|uniref:HDOD domain-containing protein n=1 Tax=Desulfospira joergensenii TaxID=53329 RepID=UPI0003B33BC4|nr:HDOD domain-containing protein [Desulfospira joergensenii]